jgi:transcriptional regulator with XRE-family HTH domain
MPNEQRHWTSENVGALVHKIGFDFVVQVEKKLESVGMTQAELARILGVSEGAISKVLNNPQNLTLKTIARYSKAIGMKFAIVGYEDSEDPDGMRGPISSEIFNYCWRMAGCPRDFWSIRPAANATTLVSNEADIRFPPAGGSTWSVMTLYAKPSTAPLYADAAGMRTGNNASAPFFAVNFWGGGLDAGR